MHKILLALFLFFTFRCIAQVDSTKSFNVNAYIETYYSYDFSKPLNNEKPDFNYNYKKHDQLNLNLAFIKANYQNKSVRSNLALMTGNYAMYNLSVEPNWAKPIFEANVGYKLLRQHNFWIDAGVMPSHIGFESAIGIDCWNLTRSILAENSPYYETGIKFSYNNKKENIYLGALVLNGWQRIATLEGSQKPSLGFQVNYKPSEKLILNYSNFIGQIQQDSISALRLFHNLYAIYETNDMLSFIFGFDIGTQKTNFNKSALWFTPVIISKFNLNDKSKIAGRVEFYSDKDQVIISTLTRNGYQTVGASVNYDHQVSPKLFWRAELKKYHSRDAIFRYVLNSQQQTSATLALILKL